MIALFFLQRLQHRNSLAVTTLLLTLLALANISLPFSHDTLFNVVGVIHYAFYFALGYFVSSFGLMRFLDKGKTAILVFLFTFVVSIIGLRINKSPLMDLFLAMDGYSYVSCFGALIRKIWTSFLQSPLPCFLYHLSLSRNLSSIEFTNTYAIYSF